MNPITNLVLQALKGDLTIHLPTAQERDSFNIDVKRNIDSLFSSLLLNVANEFKEIKDPGSIKERKRFTKPVNNLPVHGAPRFERSLFDFSMKIGGEPDLYLYEPVLSSHKSIAPILGVCYKPSAPVLGAENPHRRICHETGCQGAVAPTSKPSQMDCEMGIREQSLNEQTDRDGTGGKDANAVKNRAPAGQESWRMKTGRDCHTHKEMAAMDSITLSITDGRIVTTSHAVSQHFGKLHKNVLQAIEKLECSESFNRLNFQPVEYIDEKGEARPAYELTKDGFTFLCMGFTGKKAAEWKERYIAAFNAMEAELRHQAKPYSIGPNDTLTKEEADELRDTINQYADQLPKEQRAGFKIQGWSKLKSHFKVGYRQIPRHEFPEALSLLGRHISGYFGPEALEGPPPQATQDPALSPLAALEQHVKNARWVLSFGPEGKMRFDEIDINGRWITDSTLAKLIAEPGEISRSLLPGIIQAAATRLAA